MPRSTRPPRVADAVLFEGYLLYPYRASAQKNRLRWQFGVLTPPGFPDEPDRSPHRVPARTPPRRRRCTCGCGSCSCAPGPSTTPTAAPSTSWSTATTRHFPLGGGRAAGGRRRARRRRAGRSTTVPFELPAEHDGRARHRRPRRAALPAAERAARRRRRAAARALRRAPAAPRRRQRRPPAPTAPPREDGAADVADRRAHPARRRPRARSSRPPTRPSGPLPATPRLRQPAHLAGARRAAGAPDLLLSSPIILADHPQLAPESPTTCSTAPRSTRSSAAHAGAHRRGEGRGAGDRPARGRDHRRRRRDAARRSWSACTARSASLRPVGAARADAPARRRRPGRRRSDDVPWWDPGADASVDPETDSVLVGGTPVAKGSRVLLRPRPRRRRAGPRSSPAARPPCRRCCTTSTASVHVAVSVDGDPAAELQVAHGRFRYFRPDELEVVAVNRSWSPASATSSSPTTGSASRWRAGSPGAALPAGVEVVDFGIRGMHLAYQLLDGYDALVLVDASRRGGAARHALRARARPGRRPRTRPPGSMPHGMEPGAVLAHARRAGRTASASSDPSAGCSSSAASPRPSTRGSGCPNRWPRSSTGPAQAVVDLVGDLLDEEDQDDQVAAGGRDRRWRWRWPPRQTPDVEAVPQDPRDVGTVGMCLGIPGEIVEILADREDLAMVSVEGVKRAVNIGLLEDETLVPGDWILIHVGFALSKIDEARGQGVPGMARPGSARPTPTSSTALAESTSTRSRAMRFVDEFRDAGQGPGAGRPDRRAVRAGPALQVHGGVRRATRTRSTSTGWRTTCPRPSRWCTGPGCPVCVIPMGRVDDAIAIAEQPTTSS